MSRSSTNLSTVYTTTEQMSQQRSRSGSRSDTILRGKHVDKAQRHAAAHAHALILGADANRRHELAYVEPLVAAVAAEDCTAESTVMPARVPREARLARRAAVEALVGDRLRQLQRRPRDGCAVREELPKSAVAPPGANCVKPEVCAAARRQASPNVAAAPHNADPIDACTHGRYVPDTAAAGR
jgi:hypothetical protein